MTLLKNTAHFPYWEFDGGQRPQERDEVKVQLLLPYLTLVKVFDMIVIARNKVGQKLPTKIFIGRVREVRLKRTIFTY